MNHTKAAAITLSEINCTVTSASEAMAMKHGCKFAIIHTDAKEPLAVTGIASLHPNEEHGWVMPTLNAVAFQEVSKQDLAPHQHFNQSRGAT